MDSCLQMAVSDGCPHADLVSWLAFSPAILLLPALFSAEGMFGRGFPSIFPVSKVRDHVSQT